jgi:uncharacterized membrane protein
MLTSGPMCRGPGRTFSGSMIAGWGLFNLVEGIIDHHILGIHHVVELHGLSTYDYCFWDPDAGNA